MRTMRLRAYQAADAHALLAECMGVRRPSNLIWAMGTGKTLLALVLATLALRRRIFTHVIFVTPQVYLRGQTARYAGTRVTDPALGCTIAAIRELTGDALRNYLTTSEPGFIAAVTPQVVNNHMAYFTRPGMDARNVFLILDEGHHVHAFDPAADKNNVLSTNIARLDQRGIYRLRLTGTPYRGDGREVVASDQSELTIARLMPEFMLMTPPMCPDEILSAVEIVDGDAFSDRDDAGVPANIKAAAAAMATIWVADGRLPTIARVKPLSATQNQQSMEAICKAFTECGASVVDAYGPDPSAFVKALTAEQHGRERGTMRYADVVDVLAGLHRFTEGVDSPSRCALHLMGVPRSLAVLAQLVGRMMRCRVDLYTGKPLYSGYPPDWLWRSKATFFLAGVDNADADHCRLWLRSTLFIGAMQDAALVRRVIASMPDGFVIDHADAHAVAAKFDLKLLADARTLLAERLADWESRSDPLDEPLTVAHMLDLVADQAAAAGIDMATMTRAVQLDLLKQRGQLAGQVGRQIADLRSRGWTLVAAVERVLDTLLPTFQNETFVADPAVRTPTMRRLTGRIIDAYGRSIARVAARVEAETPRTEQDILDRVATFVAAEGRYPDLGAVDPAHPSCTFLDYDHLLRRGILGTAWLAGLPQLLLSSREPWPVALSAVQDDLSMRRSGDARSYTDAHGPRQIVLRRLYGHLPEVAYYPRALVTLERYAFAAELTIDEADVLGTVPRRRADAVRAIVAEQGIAALKQMIADRSIRAVGTVVA